jgi:hypothetical protein
MLDFIAERVIQEAIARGELDDLPGAGRPLELDDDALVPEELRLAYRILKNAGYVPEEVRTAAKKLWFLKARFEPRYYDKAIARLSASPRARRSPS